MLNSKINLSKIILIEIFRHLLFSLTWSLYILTRFDALSATLSNLHSLAAAIFKIFKIQVFIFK